MTKNKDWHGYALITLENNNGTKVELSDLGATIVNFWVVDKFNITRNIVLGYDTPQQYLDADIYLGAVVGPWANRIEQGQYRLDDKTIQLSCNENQVNHLHGAECALHKRRWSIAVQSKQGVTFECQVKQGEAGYPANLDISVTYRLSDSNELSVDYYVETDAPCAISLTQHSYFNLSAQQQSVLSHLISIDADQVLTIDENSIPTAIAAISGTAFDLNSPVKLLDRLEYVPKELEQTKGFDHCWLLKSHAMDPIAWVFEPSTGIELEVATDQPGIQLYTGNFIQSESARNGVCYEQHAGLCLETQHLPNQPNMPSRADECIYTPSKPYRHSTVFRVNSRAG